MACPPGYSIPDHILKQFPNKKLVSRLLKSLYGLKQAPRQWFIALCAALLSFGFIQTRGDPSLFVFAKGATLIYMLVYVDDMILTGNDTAVMSQVTDFLASHFKSKIWVTLIIFWVFKCCVLRQALLLTSVSM